MSLPSGTRLGAYDVVAPIGEGGMAEVYRARDTRLDRTVAVKVLLAGSAWSAEARARFEREARAISQLNHPHICTLFDVGREGDSDDPTTRSAGHSSRGRTARSRCAALTLVTRRPVGPSLTLVPGDPK